MKTAMMAATALVVLALLGMAAMLALRSEPELPGFAVAIGDAEIGGPFRLVRQDGAPVTAAEVITGPALVYFGYTFCPDVCPVDVQIIADAVDILAGQGVAVTPVFVSVDPARDTPEQLAWFAEAMHPRMVALTGDAAAVREAAAAYKVYYAKVEAEGSAADYLMNHSTYTYLMLPGGIAGLYRRGFTAEELAAEVARRLAAG